MTLSVIDIQGGHSINVVTIGDWDHRAQQFATAAHWAAMNSENVWCLSPDPSGNLEIIFANPNDLNRFMEWMIGGQNG